MMYAKSSFIVGKSLKISNIRNISNQSIPTNVSKQDSSIRSGSNAGFESLQDEFKTMKKDMKQSRDKNFELNKEKAKFMDDNLPKDGATFKGKGPNKESSFNQKEAPLMGASEFEYADSDLRGNLDAMTKEKIIKSLFEPTKPLIASLEGKPVEETLQKQQKKSISEEWKSDTSDPIHKVEDDIVKMVDNSNVSKSAETFKKTPNTSQKFADSVKGVSGYVNDLVEPMGYAALHSKVARDRLESYKEEPKEEYATIESTIGQKISEASKFAAEKIPPLASTFVEGVKSSVNFAAEKIPPLANNLKEKADELLHSETAENLKESIKEKGGQLKDTIKESIKDGSKLAYEKVKETVSSVATPSTSSTQSVEKDQAQFKQEFRDINEVELEPFDQVKDDYLRKDVKQFKKEDMNQQTKKNILAQNELQQDL